MSVSIETATLMLSAAPERGGAVTAFRWRPAPDAPWVPVFRDAAGAAREPAASSLFPMLPFANRAAGGTLIGADGTAWPVPRNHADPLPLHGNGWQLPWTVAAHTADSLTLTLETTGPAPGMAYAATMTMTLAQSRASVALTLKNTGGAPAPMGMGLHPYFPRLPDTRLTFAAAHVFGAGPDTLPTAPLDWPKALDFRTGAPVNGTGRDNAYSGWPGLAQIAQPGLGYRLTITATPVFGDAMLYVPAAGDCFAFEPQSHTSGATDASARPTDRAVIATLEPDAALRGAVHFDVAPL